VVFRGIEHRGVLQRDVVHGRHVRYCKHTTSCKHRTKAHGSVKRKHGRSIGTEDVGRDCHLCALAQHLLPHSACVSSCAGWHAGLVPRFALYMPLHHNIVNVA